jgi:hypothetical protein
VRLAFPYLTRFRVHPNILPKWCHGRSSAHRGSIACNWFQTVPA